MVADQPSAPTRALLAAMAEVDRLSDPYLHLADSRVPLDDHKGSCRNEACCCDEHCTCCTRRSELFGYACRDVEGFRRENWCEPCAKTWEWNFTQEC